MASEIQNKKWFIEQNGETIGPLSSIGLVEWALQGLVFPNDIVNINSLKESAANVKGLNPFLRTKNGPQIWAVAAGKGGVGKSILSAFFSIALASFGKKTLLIDADFAGPNLHTLFGINDETPNYGDFSKGNNVRLEDIAIQSSFDNLKIITGPEGKVGAANPFFFTKLKFLKEIRKVKSQYIILDLGPGIQYNNLDYFLSADIGIIITTPELTSIQNASGFIKSSFKRKFDIATHFLKNGEQKGILEDYSPNSILLQQLINRMNEMNLPQDNILERVLRSLNTKCVLNMTFSEEDTKVISLLSKYITSELGMRLDFVGSARFDPTLRKALFNDQIAAIATRTNPFFEDIIQIVQELMKQKKVEYVTLPPRQFITEKSEEGWICGIWCSAWDDCEFQEPGHPCPVRINF